MNPKFLLPLLLLVCAIGNAHAQDTPSSTPAAGPSATPPETTPTSLPGAESHVFKTVGDTNLLLFVMKPKSWQATDKRPCLVSFFGGGWVSGTPKASIGWAKWGADRGMVGVAPDYRTRHRFNGTPEDCVADGRAAVRWVQDHAADLGIDPAKIVSLGASAGGHVAAWTAIPDPVSPASASDPIPSPPPAALVLLWPVTDTGTSGYGGPKRFGNDAARANALSVTARMPAKMPPTIVFHGTADTTVHFQNSQDFVAKMIANGNRCELFPLEGMMHSPTSTKFGEKGKQARAKVESETEKFLASLGFVKPGAADTASPSP